MYDYEEYKLFKDKLRDKKFTQEQIDDIIDVLEDVCHYCFDGPVGCHCENDE